MFGSRFKEQRLIKGKNQKQMAEILCVSQATISNWEAGRKIPEVPMLISIAKYFNTSVDYLLGLVD